MARLVREYDYSEISRMLRKAADTIEMLSEKLREKENEEDDGGGPIG